MEVRSSRRRFLTGTAQLGVGAALFNGAPKAALGQEAASGRDLIGELEGPEVVTDESRWPKSFSEAPQLAAQVKAGKLPPVAERLGKHPLVISPVHEIGRYGGTWRRAFTGPGDLWNGWRDVSGPDNLLFFDYTAQNIVPNIARGWQTSPDGKETLIFLREGMHWSDGHPFTADDFVFWFEDVYANREIVPIPTYYFSPGGKPGRLEKVDAHTVRLSFDIGYSFIVEALAGATTLDGFSRSGRQGLGLFAPAHYLRNFLPKYAGGEKLTAEAQAAGFKSWVLYYKAKADFALNPDLPVLSPWKVVSPVNTPVWEFERNPYSIWVDTDGNQLPYIDKVSLGLAENLELLNLRTIAGDFDWQERHVDLAKLPVLLDSQKTQGYRVHLDPGDFGSDLMLYFNQSYNADPEVARWLGNVDFRRALSLAINRDELNEIFWLGVGQARTIVPADTNKYNPGPEYASLWATYDVDRANGLLDSLGLTTRDGDGYRLRSDGNGRLTFDIASHAGQSLPYGQMSEAIRSQWRSIGINTTVTEGERSMMEIRSNNNELQIFAFVGDGNDHLFTYPNIVPVVPNSNVAPLWGKWYSTRGASGAEPDPVMKGVLEKFTEALVASEEDRIRLGKEIWATIVDQVYIIGCVGLSPAYGGVRVVKTNMGNVPARQYNGPDAKTSAPSRPMTVYFV